MKILNKDITGVIFSNLNVNSIKKFMKSIKCSYTLTLLIKLFLNEQPYSLTFRNRNAILQSTILNNEYHIPIPKALKRSYLNTINWLECIAQGVFIIYQGVKIIYININKKKCSVLQITRKIYSLAVNRELSAIAICYNDYKLKSICLKVYSSEGKIMYCLPINYRIKKMVFDNESIYFIVYTKCRELSQMNLTNKENNQIYNGCKIDEIYLKNNYLFVIIKKAIMLIDTRDLNNISFIKLDSTPQRFYSLSDYSFLVLHENLLFYEFNIHSQSLKRLYFEFNMIKERHIGAHRYNVYSESKDNLIILNSKVYYIINKSNMTCTFKGLCEYDTFYIDGINNKIINFLYAGINNTISLKIEEYELIDFSKAINAYNLVPNIYTNSDCYHVPNSKNFFINFSGRAFYYNFLAGTAVDLSFIAHNILPISDTLICYKVKDCIFWYNLLTKRKTLITECPNFKSWKYMNNYLVIRNRRNILIYDLKLGCISDEIKFDDTYRFYTFFDRLICIKTGTESITYTIKNGLLEKIWTASYFNFYYDDRCVYSFAKGNQMVCIDKNASLIYKPASRENIKNMNLSLEKKKKLIRRLKKGFDDC
jgi:hypothetical protein